MNTDQLHVRHTSIRPFMETLLQEAYWCETQLCDELDNLRGKCSTDQLREALIEHLEETHNQVGRLEKICSLLGRNKDGIFCVGMQGLFDEARQAVDETPEGSAIRDAALIISLQKIEHYEIVSYGSLRVLACTLGYRDIADLLEMNLAEEQKADATLTRLANSIINPEANRESAKQTTITDANEDTTTDPTPGAADALLYDELGQPHTRNRQTKRG